MGNYMVCIIVTLEQVSNHNSNKQLYVSVQKIHIQRDASGTNVILGTPVQVLLSYEGRNQR